MDSNYTIYSVTVVDGKYGLARLFHPSETPLHRDLFSRDEFCSTIEPLIGRPAVGRSRKL